MTALQTVVMGLVIVFLDVPPDGFDWVADPFGWLLVVLGLAPLKGAVPNHLGLTVTAWICLAFSIVSWPEGSPATLSPAITSTWSGLRASTAPIRTNSRAE